MRGNASKEMGFVDKGEAWDDRKFAGTTATKAIHVAAEDGVHAACL